MRRIMKQSWLSLLVIAVTCHEAAFQEDVRQPPSIILGPSSHEIYRLDQKIPLACVASGTPKPTYEWLKNNHPLNLNVPNIRRLGEGNIEITSAGAIDEGYYQCIASNQYGKAISNGTFLQRAFQADPEAPVITELEVTEGQPFHIRFVPLKSLPKAQYRWAQADKTITTDQAPTDLTRSKRMQWAENGDLYFAYALVDDELGGKIYKGLTFNPYVDIISGGSYTRVKVIRAPGGIKPFSPMLAFSTSNETIGLEGENIVLRCFFSAYPDASVNWRGPNNNIPYRRFSMSNYQTELKITNLKPSDSGTYVCEGSNPHGRQSKEIKLVVQAVPVFHRASDRPQDANVTEGDSKTFHCNAYARPEANVTWMINGAPLNPMIPPSRISISADRHNLTVRNVCRDCTDREFFSDLMVIQCNASNKHGYAFGAGYLNVLKKTSVRLIGENSVAVDYNERRTLQFQCIGTSDPSTAVRVTWYKVTDEQLPVRSESPAVVVGDGMLTITAGDNTSSSWDKHEGRYQCVASNGYSEANVTINIAVLLAPVLEPQKADIWWIFVIIACLFLIIILIFACCICLFRNRGDKYDVDGKERKNGNDPVKELVDSGFRDYQRTELEPFKGSQNSLGSSARLFGDEEVSEVGEHSKFLENGSFHSTSYANTVDRMRGRSEIV